VSAARRPAAAFLLAWAGLAAELAWTRVAGLVFFGETAFLVVTLAVAGLALGAAAGAARPAWLRRDAAAGAAVLAGVATAIGLAVALAAAGRGGPFATLAAALPGFAMLGLAFAGLFAGDPRHAPRLYAADLTGAALGAATSVPLLGLLGAPDAVLAAAGAAAAGGAALAARPALRTAAMVLAAGAGIAVVAAVPDLDPARLATPKPIVAELARGGERTASRWGTLGRSDLVRRGDGAEVLYLDGGAGSLLPTPASAPLWRGDLGRFAFEALRPERAFVVGAGAGLEVAHALETGARRVLAAEVNGAGAALARERLARARAEAPDAGEVADPFGAPSVRWVRDEARAALRASGERFDLIALSQAVTRTAEARGLALTENGLYTVEATAGWLDALAPGGAVAFELYDELTLTRTLITVATALREFGPASTDAEALRHLVALLDPATTPPTPLLLAFRDAPGPETVVDLARAAEADGLALLHLPGLLENPPLDAVAAGTRSLDALVAAADGVDIAPTRDAAPFFWSFEPGVPRVLRRLLAGLALATAVLTPPLVLLRRGAPRPAQVPASPGRRRGLAVAGLLGVAFLALELALLSRTGLLLGHPALALAVTLGGLLSGAGAGAAWARRRPDAWSSLARAALIAGAAAAAWALAWPPLAAAMAGAAPWARATVAAASLLPLGAALGAPFPLLLRRLGSGAGGAGEVARAWALNGLGSLLGGVGATATAHLVGFDAVTAIAAGTYLAAAGVAATVRDSGEVDPDLALP
jgi:hypothetical protein